MTFVTGDDLCQGVCVGWVPQQIVGGVTEVSQQRSSQVQLQTDLPLLILSDSP